jgi:hypothetical protein
VPNLLFCVGKAVADVGLAELAVLVVLAVYVFAMAKPFK